MTWGRKEGCGCLCSCSFALLDGSWNSRRWVSAHTARRASRSSPATAIPHLLLAVCCEALWRLEPQCFSVCYMVHSIREHVGCRLTSSGADHTMCQDASARGKKAVTHSRATDIAQCVTPQQKDDQYQSQAGMISVFETSRIKFVL